MTVYDITDTKQSCRTCQFYACQPCFSLTGQQKAMRMRQIVDEMAVHYLKQSNAQEHAFWDKLIKTCLKPDLKAFGLEGEVKCKYIIKDFFSTKISQTNK